MHTGPRGNEFLRKAREEQGWTQRRLAEVVGVEEQTVSSWERGRRLPSVEFRHRLSELLGKTPQQLGLERADLQEREELSISAEIHKQEECSSGVEEDRQEHLAFPISAQEQKAGIPLVEENGQQLVHSIQPVQPVPSWPISAPYEEQNRSRMLHLVRSLWITGVLAHSLAHTTMLSLDLQEQPDAVVNPWQHTVQDTQFSPHSLPSGTTIVEVYDTALGSLCILGEAGSGKTTLLLALTRALIERAEQHKQHPIPVVFHLASWTPASHTLTDWLIEELQGKYQVPRAVGQQWIETHQLLPLLDGLDEVAASQRSACIDVVNRYHQAHYLVPLVICCRQTAYREQARRLTLHNAVMIQPLTREQINGVLSLKGEETLRQVLQEDTDLQAFAATPLMLNVLMLAYQGTPIDTFLRQASPEERRERVFATYVQQMLTRRAAKTRYRPQQTTRWLTWLAQHLETHQQTEFHVERMQPSWLPPPLRQRYRQTTTRVIFGLLILVNAALFAWLRGGQRGQVFGLKVGLLGMLGAGPGNTLLGWMAPGLGGGLEGGGSLGILLSIVSVLIILLVGSPTLPSFSAPMLWKSVWNGLRSGFIIGGMLGLVAWVIFSFHYGLVRGGYRGLGIGLFSALLIGLMTGLIAALRPPHVSCQGTDDQQSPHTRRYHALYDTILFSLLAGGSNGGVDALLVHAVTPDVLAYGAIVGLFYGIAFGIAGGTQMIHGLGITILPTETVAWSWPHVKRHLAEESKKGIVLGLCVMLPVVLVIGSASALFYGISYGVRFGLVFGSIVGCVGAVAATLTGILKRGWTSNVLTDEQLMRPNEGIRRSLSHAVFAACFFGLAGGESGGLVCGLAFGLFGRLQGWMILGEGFALICGILFAIHALCLYGGIAYTEHYLLRWYLWRYGSIPGNYVAFLDYAAERVLLRKIGGGYSFAHRLLQDYFASLAPDTLRELQAIKGQECE